MTETMESLPIVLLALLWAGSIVIALRLFYLWARRPCFGLVECVLLALFLAVDIMFPLLVRATCSL
jgi:hypothetical protein